MSSSSTSGSASREMCTICREKPASGPDQDRGLCTGCAKRLRRANLLGPATPEAEKPQEGHNPSSLEDRSDVESLGGNRYVIQT